MRLGPAGGGGGACCRRDVRDRHSPRSVCNEWRDHRVSAVLAALGSSHPFLEPECALGARGVAGRRKDLDWKLALLVWKQPGLRAASRASAFSLPHAGEAHPALPGHRANPRGVLPARPNPPLPRLRLRLPDPCALSESHRRTGAHHARRRCFSFKKKPSPLRRQEAAAWTYSGKTAACACAPRAPCKACREL